MARVRSLKPEFFLDPDLADQPPLNRLLFEGLWGIADREGRLEDEPRRIKVQVLPYDEVDVDAMLQALHNAGFIQRYAVDDRRYIWVVNFSHHQTPHQREANSKIPPPSEGKTSPIPALALHQPSPSLAPAQPTPSQPDTDTDTDTDIVPDAGGGLGEGSERNGSSSPHRQTFIQQITKAISSPEPRDGPAIAALVDSYPGVDLAYEVARAKSYHRILTARKFHNWISHGKQVRLLDGTFGDPARGAKENWGLPAAPNGHQPPPPGEAWETYTCPDLPALTGVADFDNWMRRFCYRRDEYGTHGFAFIDPQGFQLIAAEEGRLIVSHPNPFVLQADVNRRLLAAYDESGGSGQVQLTVQQGATA